MKRETRKMLKGRFGLSDAQLADALATDAEVKRLRAVIRKVLARLADEEMEADDYSPVDDLRAALKPRKRR